MLTRSGIARHDTTERCGEVQVELYYKDLGDPSGSAGAADHGARRPIVETRIENFALAR